MKWLEIDQDNLQMKFSASNIDVSSLSPNTLGSKIEACERERQREVPPPKKKNGYFIDIGSSIEKTVLNRYRHATYLNKHW